VDLAQSGVCFYSITHSIPCKGEFERSELAGYTWPYSGFWGILRGLRSTFTGTPPGHRHAIEVLDWLLRRKASSECFCSRGLQQNTVA
jgi:hypothetical protein